MTRRMMAVAAKTASVIALLAGCGSPQPPMPTGPGSELIGRWSADVRAMLSPGEAAEYGLLVISVTFEANNTYSMEARVNVAATATATPSRGCSMVFNSAGGTWSVAGDAGANTLTTGGVVTGTVVRSGCSNAAESHERRAANRDELYSLRPAIYSVTGNSLTMRTPGGTPVVFTR
ncbi:MAG: hypothetical protein Q8Q09_28400 [Deltaproteobacteria bacterium]|nr:hypothetical protein [Deltaproteobacteria bacterium]